MKIAIIGSGISGLSAAYFLNPHHQICLYEKNNTLGGHSRTVDIEINGKPVAVDTGFIVFNYKNYPHLTELFKHLSVEVAPSNMSFGVSINNGWFEYGTNGVANLFAQKRNLLRYSFWRMLADIIQFNRKAKAFLNNPSSISLGEFLDKIKVGDWFTHYYLLAMGGSIWSMPAQEMRNFPAQSFLRFFDNHGLLSIASQPQWFTVVGGSKVYVDKISQSFKDKIKLNCNIKKIIRNQDGVCIEEANGKIESYDKIIFACHSDQSLALLSDASDAEKDVLEKIKYQKNSVFLHSDKDFMPKRKKAYSSWVCLANSSNPSNPSSQSKIKSTPISLTYWMNNLQPLNTNHPVFITLNPNSKPKNLYESHCFEHPVFNQQAIEAQKKLALIQGDNNTYYCGAWTRYGFHEDGILSAVKVAKLFGAQPQW